MMTRFEINDLMRDLKDVLARLDALEIYAAAARVSEAIDILEDNTAQQVTDDE